MEKLGEIRLASSVKIDYLGQSGTDWYCDLYAATATATTMSV